MLLVKLWAKKITWMALMGTLCVATASAGWAQMSGSSRPNVRAKHKLQPLPPVDVTKLVWPLPPRVARIRYVTQMVGERDLIGVKQKKPSWLEKAAGISTADQERPHLRKPYGVAVDSKGLVYVGDSALHRVFVFDLEKKQLTYRGDKPPAQFSVIIGLAIDDKDRLFVSDAVLHQITVFDANGGFLSVFGENELTRPAGIAVDNDLRRLYVADVKGARLAIFDLDTYKLIRYINSQGPTPEEPHGFLGTPTNLTVDPDGLVYVVDTIPNRVEVFDTDGNYVRGFGEQGTAPGTFARPKGIAVDSDGHIYVADDEFNNFQIFTPEGKPLMAVGNFGQQPGQFMLLTALAFDKNNRLFATDGGALPRVEVFQYITDPQAEAELARRGGGDAKDAQKKGEPK
jgi:DNA-binding beta-propeller fold protein YncE